MTSASINVQSASVLQNHPQRFGGCLKISPAVTDIIGPSGIPPSDTDIFLYMIGHHMAMPANCAYVQIQAGHPQSFLVN